MATTPARRMRHQELRLGRRRLFILDGVLDPGAVRWVHRRFAGLPVTLSDSDRPDTGHVRHLKHEFDPEEWERDPALASLTSCARGFLTRRGIAAGAPYRIYANFNLHGDFQFAHEDGEGFTALAFLNATWKEDWGGELIAYPGGGAPFAYCIAPRPGRMVVFDGMIRHRGGSPSKLCLVARISLAIKLRPGRRGGASRGPVSARSVKQGSFD